MNDPKSLRSALRDDSTARGPSESDGLRCPCGSLLARVVDGKLELKCRRCRRTIVVQVEGLEKLASD